MTMSFPVAPAALMDGREPGELVTATLEVGDAGGRLIGDRRGPGIGAAAEHDPKSRSRAASLERRRRSAGRGVHRSARPAAVVLGMARLADARHVHLHALSAADVLPADGSELRDDSARDRRGCRARAARVKLVSISFDPEHDTPAVLAAHAAKLQGRPGGLDVPHRRPGDGRSVRRPVRRRRHPAGRRRPRSRTTCGRSLIGADGRVVRIYSGQRLDAGRGARRPARRSSGSRDRGAAPAARRRSPRPNGASIARLRTPAAVQRFLNALPYNTEPPPDPATLRSFRGVVAHHTAHCLEAAISAAVILEQHGYPPHVMSLESIDGLDHVIFVYQAARPMGIGGAVARSRPARPPAGVPHAARSWRCSYFEPYIDKTGCLKAYGAVDLRVLGRYDWRLSRRQCLEGRAAAVRDPAPADPLLAARVVAAAPAVLRVQRRAPGPEAGRTTTGAPGRLPTSSNGVIGNRELSNGTVAERQLPSSNCPLPMLAQSRSKSRCGFVTGSSLACLSASSKRLRQRVAARLLGLHGLLEQRVAARFLLGQNPVRLVELRLVGALGFDVTDDALAVPRR